MNELILILALFGSSQREAYDLIRRTGTSQELAEYVRIEAVLTFGARVEREYEEIGFDSIAIDGPDVVVTEGGRDIRIPRSAFGNAEIWVGTGFSRFSAPGRARYIAIRRERGVIVAAEIHMNAL